jgi:hypothetical protein
VKFISEGTFLLKTEVTSSNTNGMSAEEAPERKTETNKMETCTIR